MAGYKVTVHCYQTPVFFLSRTSLMQRSSSRFTPHLNKIIKTSLPQSRNMSVFFPRVAFGPARCAPLVVRNDISPFISLFNESLNDLHRATRTTRKHFNPRFDVKEAKDSYTVDAELPGVDPKDVSIEFTDEHTLTVKGHTERVTESATKATNATESQEKAAVEDEAAGVADTASTKSHQPSVEDEEAPPNSSAAPESTETAAPAPKATEEAPEAEPRSRYWISERRVGDFSRSFEFSSRVDQDAVKASLKNGILSIVVPKAAVPESRRIQIE